jgi:hypothetical protein
VFLRNWPDCRGLADQKRSSWYTGFALLLLPVAFPPVAQLGNALELCVQKAKWPMGRLIAAKGSPGRVQTEGSSGEVRPPCNKAPPGPKKSACGHYCLPPFFAAAP